MKDSTSLPTFFIDEPAADALMKAMASASPADVAAALKSPLQIRPTFHALSVASSLNDGGETYDITVCTIPANTIKPLHAAVGEADLENARRDSQNFQDGGVEVAGFEGNTGIQRFAVCISQALRIWLADPAIPEPVLSTENEIVFITGENPELKLVSGEERPSLEFMKYNMETGKPESCSLALYGTSPAELETFSAENAEIFCMSKTVRDRQTGEERTVPVFGAEAEAVRYKLSLIQRGKEILDSKHYNLRGNPSCNGGDFGGTDIEKTFSARIFVSTEALQKLPILPFEPKNLPERLRKKCLLDFMDVPLSAIIETNREKRISDLSLYKRIAVTMFSPNIASMKYERRGNQEFFSDGNITLHGVENDGLTAVAVFDAFRKIAGVLVACGCMDKVSTAKNTGLFITVTDEQIIAVAELTGSRRPPLASYLSDSFQMLRPYTDENNDDGDDDDDDIDGDNSGETGEAEHTDDKTGNADENSSAADGVKVIAALSPEQIEALLARKTEKQEQEPVTLEALMRAAAAGDAAAMKRLGKMYETGEGAEQDNGRALELYKKAQELLPDDKDLEFDIFMLEMMM